METEGQVTEQPSIEQRFMNLDAPPQEETPEPDAAPEPEAEAKQEEAPKDDEHVIEIDPEAPLFDLRVKKEGGDEEERKVSLADLQKGYMMQADYQRKTAEIARARETMQAEIKKAVEPELQKYENNVRVFQKAVVDLAAPELSDVNWTALAKDDPARFVELQAKAQHFQQVLNSAHQELQRIDAQRKAEMEQAMQKQASEAVETLRRDIPSWSDELYSKVLKTGIEDYGYTMDEVGKVTDPRAIKVLHDAMKYRQLQSAKPIVEKRLVAVPKVLKPGATTQSDSETQKEQEARKALKKSGSLDDAAQVFLNRMNRS